MPPDWRVLPGAGKVVKTNPMKVKTIYFLKSDDQRNISK